MISSATVLVVRGFQIWSLMACLRCFLVCVVQRKWLAFGEPPCKSQSCISVIERVELRREVIHHFFSLLMLWWCRRQFTGVGVKLRRFFGFDCKKNNLGWHCFMQRLPVWRLFSFIRSMSMWPILLSFIIEMRCVLPCIIKWTHTLYLWAHSKWGRRLPQSKHRQWDMYSTHLSVLVTSYIMKREKYYLPVITS